MNNTVTILYGNNFSISRLSKMKCLQFLAWEYVNILYYILPRQKRHQFIELVLMKPLVWGRKPKVKSAHGETKADTPRDRPIRP